MKCSHCRREAEPGKTRCRPCLDAAVAWRERVRAAGLCTCGRKVAPGKSLCRKHLRRQAERRREFYQLHKAKGACTAPGCKRKPFRGTIHCRKHHAAYADYLKKSRAKKHQPATA